MQLIEIAHINDLCERLIFDPLAPAVLPPALAALLETVISYEPIYDATLTSWLNCEYTRMDPTVEQQWAAARDHSSELKAQFAEAYNAWTATLDPQARCQACGYFALGGLCAACAEQAGRQGAPEEVAWNS